MSARPPKISIRARRRGASGEFADDCGRAPDRVWKLGPGRYRIGRVSACDVVLDDPAVSRIHARLEYDPAAPLARVHDARSENGTWLAEQAIRWTDVRSGDRIRVGAVELEIGMDANAAEWPPRATRPAPAPRLPWSLKGGVAALAASGAFFFSTLESAPPPRSAEFSGPSAPSAPSAASGPAATAEAAPPAPVAGTSTPARGGAGSPSEASLDPEDGVQADRLVPSEARPEGGLPARAAGGPTRVGARASRASRPSNAARAAAGSVGARGPDIAHRRSRDPERARALSRYARGDFEGARAAARRARQDPRGLEAALAELERQHARVRTEVSNDVERAHALFERLLATEARWLPAGVRSSVVADLEDALVEAHARVGAARFEAARFEAAFAAWSRGLELAPEDPRLTAGMEQLQRRARAWADEAEVAGQRGDPAACEKWRRVRSVTPGTSALHETARRRIDVWCSKD